MISELILKGEFDGIKEIMEKSANAGMQTFDNALLDLYKEGLIGREEALKNADSENNVRLKIKFADEGKSMESDGTLSFSLESLEEDQGQIYEG
jgi:twitching motility protein PilU